MGKRARSAKPAAAGKATTDNPEGLPVYVVTWKDGQEHRQPAKDEAAARAAAWQFRHEAPESCTLAS